MNLRVLAQLALLTLVVSCLVPALALGQEPKSRSFYPDEKWYGLGLQGSFPYAEFADSTDTGFGIVAVIDYSLVPMFSVVGNLGYNRFGGKGEAKDQEIWEFSAGGRAKLPPFFIGGEAGWFTGVEKVGWVPSLGLRFERIELSVRWQASGTEGWTTLRFGFYF